jgi:hypothetical protein
MARRRRLRCWRANRAHATPPPGRPRAVLAPARAPGRPRRRRRAVYHWVMVARARPDLSTQPARRLMTDRAITDGRAIAQPAKSEESLPGAGGDLDPSRAARCLLARRLLPLRGPLTRNAHPGPGRRHPTTLTRPPSATRDPDQPAPGPHKPDQPAPVPDQPTLPGPGSAGSARTRISRLRRRGGRRRRHWQRRALSRHGGAGACGPRWRRGRFRNRGERGPGCESSRNRDRGGALRPPRRVGRARPVRRRQRRATAMPRRRGPAWGFDSRHYAGWSGRRRPGRAFMHDNRPFLLIQRSA